MIDGVAAGLSSLSLHAEMNGIAPRIIKGAQRFTLVPKLIMLMGKFLKLFGDAKRTPLTKIVLIFHNLIKNFDFYERSGRVTGGRLTMDHICSENSLQIIFFVRSPSNEVICMKNSHLSRI
ncbi:hypothetical protein A3715_30865 [Oleiphilus sp. HI0009]|nr:hypothetical protein A3715_30865 [Oleiphilus sp. HI0009]